MLITLLLIVGKYFQPKFSLHMFWQQYGALRMFSPLLLTFKDRGIIMVKLCCNSIVVNCVLVTTFSISPRYNEWDGFTTHYIIEIGMKNELGNVAIKSFLVITCTLWSDIFKLLCSWKEVLKMNKQPVWKEMTFQVSLFIAPFQEIVSPASANFLAFLSLPWARGLKLAGIYHLYTLVQT